MSHRGGDLLQPASHRQGKVGHVLEAAGQGLVQPCVQLVSPVGGFVQRQDEIQQLGIGQIQEGYLRFCVFGCLI